MMKMNGQITLMTAKMSHKTYSEAYSYGCNRLKKADIDDGELDAKLLLEYVCGTDINHLYAHGDTIVDDDELQKYDSLLSKRAEHIPLQYLTGTQDFMGLDFGVSGNVLIPRQDTEILVEEAMKELHDGMRILDMCTGSGCILLSLLHYSNECSGVGADISDEAVRLAEENADKLGISGAKFIKSDLFSECPDEKYDMIISNPPYIKTDVIKTLMPEVREHEPLGALDGSSDGLLFYRKIISGAGRYLCGGGLLYFEIGYDQAADVSDMMKDAGYIDVTVVKDYAGMDRVVYGSRAFMIKNGATDV